MKRICLNENDISTFLEEIEDKFPDEKTEWSELVRRLLSEDKIPSLEDLFSSQRNNHH